MKIPYAGKQTIDEVVLGLLRRAQLCGDMEAN